MILLKKDTKVSFQKLFELVKNRKPVDPNGREYYRKEIIGADAGHWLVQYTYHVPGGYSYNSFWERMSDQQMRNTHCYAADYTGPK